MTTITSNEAQTIWATVTYLPYTASRREQLAVAWLGIRGVFGNLKNIIRGRLTLNMAERHIAGIITVKNRSIPPQG
jgi:hypothetical protein